MVNLVLLIRIVIKLNRFVQLVQPKEKLFLYGQIVWWTIRKVVLLPIPIHFHEQRRVYLVEVERDRIVKPVLKTFTIRRTTIRSL
jgi:hypothetical protein